MKRYPFKRTPRELLAAMVEQAWTIRALYSPIPERYKKIGSMIEELSPEERKVIQELKPENIDSIPARIKPLIGEK